MKDTLRDANFPKTACGRVYHLGIKSGEVANRIVTVGAISRAKEIATYLDASPQPFSLCSERGFLTITGRYRGVPVSVVCIGMGGPNVDFFIREVRECLQGEMIVVRLGSCGCLTDLPVGSLVIPKASIAVTRNLDFDFANGDHWRVPYRLSKPIPADSDLILTLQRALESSRPVGASNLIAPNTVNASTDSFYSSQGRQTSFQDYNAGLIGHLKETIEDIATLEMETYWVFHLAASWRGLPSPLPAHPVKDTLGRPSIRAAAVQMVFASRSSQEFITPEHVTKLEAWGGQAVLEALCAMDISQDQLHPQKGSVWDLESVPLEAAP
ncbi:nucleoside phosphorylase domain-containing protein [Boletus coccyginus]|nr:nucleoside phosphorylase domain-containing protein [Boletus coccyginus]